LIQSKRLVFFLVVLLLCFSGTVVCMRVEASTPQQNTTEKLQITTLNGENITLTLNGNISAAQISDVFFVNRPDFYNNTNLDFTVTGQNNTVGFLNMTIPKSSVLGGTEPGVYVPGVNQLNDSFCQDKENFYVWFTVPFNAQNFDRPQAEILFVLVTHRATEPPLNGWYIWVIAVGLALAVILAIVRYRRIQTKHAFSISFQNPR
jgi:hypothetical protein